MGKIKMFILGTIVAALILVLPYFKISASDDNDILFKAIEFTSKKPVSDAIETEADVDWFKYTVNSNGTISFSIANLSGKNGRWHITMYDENGQKSIWDYYTDSNAGASVSPLYSFAKGTVLTFKISNSYQAVGLDYQLSAIVDENGDWADEDNDNYLKASELTNKKPLLGIINFDSDVDWYKYTVDNTNPFKVSLNNMSGENARWHLLIYDSDASTILWDKHGDSSAASIVSINLMYEKGHELYIKVENTYNSFNKKYQMSTIIDNSDGWATEDNGSFEKAYKISSAKGVKEFIGPNTDVDWYVYSAQNNEKVKFEFSNTESQKGRWIIQFYENNTDNMINKKETQLDEFSYNYETDVIKGTKYYIAISNGYNANDVIYKITVKDSVKNTTKDSGNTDNSSTGEVSNIETPYSILAGTNVIVGKAEAGATVYVKQGKKTYSAVADSNGIYRVKTAKLGKGKSVKIWQKIGKTTSKKVTVKVVESY